MGSYAWIIAALPLASFALIAAGARRWPSASAWLTIVSIGGAAVMSWLVFAQLAGGAPHIEAKVPWLALGDRAPLSLGFQVDPLTATMLIVVTSVSLLVQIYSLGYMHGDTGYSRYYASMSLFTFSML